MSPDREKKRAALAVRTALLAVALVTGLVACSGGGPSGAGPDPNALPPVSATGEPSGVEAPDVTPTRASTGLETPLPKAPRKAAVLLAAAAEGSPQLVDGHPGVECVYFHLVPPTLPEGAAFVVDHVKVSPKLWKPVAVDCQNPVCVGAALTSQDGSDLCAVALARTDGPHATRPTGSVVRLIGSVRCGAPATHAQCAALRAALVAHAKEPGSALPLDLESADGSGAGDGSGDGSGSTDDSGSTAGTGDSGNGGDVATAEPSEGG